MRYGKEHKAETRQQILIQAARHFLADGIAETGIAGLMAEAGLTHGGFYAHFANKDELVAAAIASGFAHTRAALARAAAETGLEGIVRLYLGPRHRDMPGKGCFAALLSQEIARMPAKVRDSFTTEVAALLRLIGDNLPPPSAGKRWTQRSRDDRAIMILAAMMGSLQLARAVTDEKQSDRILVLGIDAALTLAAPK
ncbi:MAG TPA: TetR/AcrR family transcriptional regulator [Dongiaceae bacterium]|nr:TetR/AcrR family transcriptional regulator [Dongiaceae bacterium]